MSDLVTCNNCGATIDDGASKCAACGTSAPLGDWGKRTTRTPATRPAGWYADQENPQSQRYWDGEGWTNDTAIGPRAGWYTDPEHPGRQRYWNGTQWSDERGVTPSQRPVHAVSRDPDYESAPHPSARLAPKPRRRGTVAGLIALIAVLAAGACAGGYLAGHSTGEDLTAARAIGTAAGKKAGAEKGTRRGYAEGLKAGQRRGYKQAYPEAYNTAYRKAFRDAGLPTPDNVSVQKQP